MARRGEGGERLRDREDYEIAEVARRSSRRRAPRYLVARRDR